MRKRTSKAAVAAMGIDVSDKKSRICVLDAEGVVVEEATIQTTPEAFERRFAGAPRCRIAIEAGTHSPWLAQVLEECGHEVLVANPRKLRLIYENESKDDRVDAEYLARVARLDPKLLAPIEHRDEQAQADREVLKARDLLVRSRTKLVNHVRGVVKSAGARVPKCSAEAFAGTARDHVPKALHAAIAPLLRTIEQLNKEIRGFDKRCESIAKTRYPVTTRLQQVPGVGPIIALAFVVTIADPSRFKKSRAVGSYLGLRPRKNESGESNPQLRITKTGDGFLRRLLVQGAQRALGPFGSDCDLRRWGLRLAERGGKNAKKRATVAVARKLAVLLHKLWVSGEDFVPLRAEVATSSSGT
jgi:transposase